MKRLLTFIIAAIIFFPCGAQSWEEIKSSRQYIYGEGWGSSDAEADKNALADLISKISVQVQSSFTLTEDELSHNGQVDGETYARSKVQTYSQATLTNTEKIVIEYEPDAHVGRYILKSEISRIFEARRRRSDFAAEFVEDHRLDHRPAVVDTHEIFSAHKFSPIGAG